jgi:magnesium transporter
VTEVIQGLGAAERERVAELRAQRRFFWLDASLADTTRADLAESLGCPEDTVPSRTLRADGETIVFALRCYVESAAAGDGDYRLRPVDVQVVITGGYLLTLHEERLSLPDALAPDLPEGRTRRYVVYAVLDAMLASTFDALEEVELSLDTLAATWTGGHGAPAPRTTLRNAGARLATMRRSVRTEQPVVERVGVEVAALPGFEANGETYFDRLDEQVNRLLGAIDAAANGLGMLLDLQLNERAYVVSVVATIFVPLTFVTGFFGMNFGWLIDQIDSPIAFWLFGFVIPIAAGALSWRLWVRRFVMGDRA